MQEGNQEPTTAGEAPRYASVQDYIRVLKRRRWLIAAIVTAGFVIALAGSLARQTTYEASAQLLFRDPLQDILVVAGRNALPEQGPGQRAAISADRITSPEVTREVIDRLDSANSVRAMESLVTTRVELQTNLVEIRARSSSGRSAARIANAYAHEARNVISKDAIDRLKEVEDQLRQELEETRKRVPELSGRVSMQALQLGQINILAEVAEPVRITSRAEVPSAPVSPHPARDAGTGLVLGLVLGLLAAFIRDGLDRRLHNAHEVHQEIDLPVVGRISDTAFAYAGLARNGNPPMSETDFEAFRVLRMNLGFLAQGRAPRSVLVTSGLPKEGKSTVSMALASAAALAGQRVLLVECDLRLPSFSRRLGIPREPGLTDYLLGTSTPQDILRTVELTEPMTVNGARAMRRPGPVGTLVCITAGAPASVPAELLGTERFSDFLEKVSKVYDLVVLDGSPLLAVADPLQVLPQVDAALLCVRVRQTTREEARAARHALAHVPERPIGAVVTGIRRGDPDAYDYYYGY
jgi:capsular exopolysaccharide synthesis family protein